MTLLVGSVAEEHRRGVAGVTGPNTPVAPPAAVGNVTPYSAMAIWQSYGIQGNPTRFDQPYAGERLPQPTATPPVTARYRQGNVDAWLATYADMGVYYVRMKYNPANAGARRAVTQLRGYGMKALMPVLSEGTGTPTNDTDADVQAAVQGIRDNAADVCIGIEGVNEPQYNRGTNAPPVPPDWAAITVARQRVIHDEIQGSAALRGTVMSVGPSLQDNASDDSYTGAQTLATRAGLTIAQIRYRGGVASFAALPTTGRTVGDTWLITGTTNNYAWTGTTWAGPVTINGGPKHFHQLVDLGILDLIDMWGQHTYPGRGDMPLGGRGGGYPARVNRMWGATGEGFPVWVTEWGYSTATGNTTSGHAVATEDAAATYGPRALFEFYAGFGLSTRPDKVLLSRFEGVDDYDPGAADTVESHFGVIGVSSTSAVDAYDPTRWRNKPEVAAMRTVLQWLKPPAGTTPYTPRPVDLTVTRSAEATDLRWVPVQKHDGSVWVVYWRNALTMDLETKTALRVAPVTFTLDDADGRRTLADADAYVRWVQVAQ